MDLFKPRGAQTIRRPLDNSKSNGQIINPPRFNDFGGLTNAGKAGSKNKMTLSNPGDTKKVI